MIALHGYRMTYPRCIGHYDYCEGIRIVHGYFRNDFVARIMPIMLINFFFKLMGLTGAALANITF